MGSARLNYYIARVLREIRTDRHRKEELRSQLEAQLTANGTGKAALSAAMAAMGDPVSQGKRLARENDAYALPLDYVSAVLPWLIGPVWLVVMSMAQDAVPLWFAALAAVASGAFAGRRFSKKGLCIFTCLLPAIYILLWFAGANSGNFQVHVLQTGVWMFGFSMSCLAGWVSVFVPAGHMLAVSGAAAGALFVVACGLMGGFREKAQTLWMAESSALADLSTRLEEIALSHPESYDLAMPYGSAAVIDICSQGENIWGTLEKALYDLALFVDDYDEFRGGTRRQAILDSQYETLSRQVLSFGQSVDCAALNDMDYDQRREMVDRVLLQLSDAFEDGIVHHQGLFPGMSSSRFRQLYSAAADIEAEFYAELEKYTITRQAQEPAMDIVTAEYVNSHMTEEDIRQKCMDEVGFIISEGEKISTQRLTELFSITGFTAPEDYYINGTRSDIVRYILVWYDGEGFQMTTGETFEDEDGENAGALYDHICAEAREIVDSVSGQGN